MGRATMWLKGLFGIKSKGSGDRKIKKEGTSQDSGGGFYRDPWTSPPNVSAIDAAWIRSFYDDETEKEQNKHAIAVAAASAAAADAALAAARAAAAVVRLSSHGRGTMFGGGGAWWAAVKIQAVFRGYLARKALRAIKALVKLQALVRGFLIRKQAKAALYSMQALIRAQETFRSRRVSHSLIAMDNHRLKIGLQNSMEKFDETRSQHPASIHSRRQSASLDSTNLVNCHDNINPESPKIVKVDTGKPKSRSCRTNISISGFSNDPFYAAFSSPIRSWVSPHSSMPDTQNIQDSYDRGMTRNERTLSTVQCTQIFTNTRPTTPVRSIGEDNFLISCPNYMAKTQSFRAKVRSESSPRQRPEVFEPNTKRLSLDEFIKSRNSLSGVWMQRPEGHVHKRKM